MNRRRKQDSDFGSPPPSLPMPTGRGPPPSAAVVHSALVVAQLAFGGGAVVGKFGVHGTNPVLFAFIREAIAGPILCICAYMKTGRALPLPFDACGVALAGSAIFFNQFFFIVGLNLADPVAASAWQPSQPIMTLVLVVLLGQEVVTWRKGLGISMAVLGAVILVIGKASSTPGGPGLNSSPFLQLAGHGCFFLNCMGTSVYVLASKQLLARHYDSMSVTGWSYLVGSVFMFVSLIGINSNAPLLRLVCSSSDTEKEELCMANAWSVPSSMVWPLAYWIFMSSILAYFLMTWANNYAKASAVSAYTVLQPAASGTLSALLFVIGGSEWASSYGFKLPGWGDLVVVLGIVAGLVVLFSDSEVMTSADAAGKVLEDADSKDRDGTTVLGKTSNSRRMRELGSVEENQPLHAHDDDDEGNSPRW